MNYLYWYWGIGVAVMLVMYISHRLSVKKNEADLLAILESINPDRDKWHYKLKEKILLPLLLVSLGPFLWPILIYWKAKEFFSQNNVGEAPEDKVFTVANTDLIKLMPITEIERMEMVHDPLGAVPDIAFGHLNSAWEKFKANAQANDEIWTFMATWSESWRKQNRHGYAILHDNQVAHHFMTGWENIELPPTKND